MAHHCQRGERDAALWNGAEDYGINPILISNGITLPADALINPAFVDLGAEEIYARLRKQGQESGPAQPPSQSSGQSAGAGGGNSPEQTPQITRQETQSPEQQSQSQPELSAG